MSKSHANELEDVKPEIKVTQLLDLDDVDEDEDVDDDDDDEDEVSIGDENFRLLESHMVQVRTCDRCSYSCCTEEGMEQHRAAVHFKCLKCQQFYHRPNHLRSHVLSGCLGISRDREDETRDRGDQNRDSVDGIHDHGRDREDSSSSSKTTCA